MKLNKLVQIISEAIGFGFSLGYLKSLKSFSQKLKYCKQYLGNHIGNGSSRICFQLNDNMILKLAKNTKGLYQNEKEGQFDYYRDTFDIFPQVYYDLSDQEHYTYIVSEYVLPVKEKDFKVCLGMSSDEFYGFLKSCASYYDRNYISSFSDEEFQEMLENNEELDKWYAYMCDYQMKPYDLRNANFGMVLRDGQPTIVMLDSGLDEYIYKKFYKR